LLNISSVHARFYLIDPDLLLISSHFTESNSSLSGPHREGQYTQTMSRHIVEIANPLPGGQCFTSTKRAKQYCSTGAAFMLRDGRLQFRARVQEQRRQASDIYIRGTVWWNGSDKDPLATHRPGDVVS
jgi:hypothetical protein